MHRSVIWIQDTRFEYTNPKAYNSQSLIFLWHPTRVNTRSQRIMQSSLAVALLLDQVLDLCMNAVKLGWTVSQHCVELRLCENLCALLCRMEIKRVNGCVRVSLLGCNGAPDRSVAP
jgi:hypothetical protein